MNRTVERREGLEPIRFQIYEETAPLRRTLAWGSAGVEAIMARYYPFGESLFEMEMDVPLARAQFQKFEELLRENGVDVIEVKDLVAQQISQSTMEPTSRGLTDLADKIIRRCYEVKAKYAERVSEEDGGREPGMEPISWVIQILNEDAERYGDDKVAILLNEVLANFPGLPLANILFGRD